MGNFTHWSPAKRLAGRLIEACPGLDAFLEAGRNEVGELQSEYAVLSFGLKPYIQDLQRKGDVQSLGRVWAIVEELVQAEGPTFQSDLASALEEIEREPFDSYLGPSTRRLWQRVQNET